MLNRCEIIGNCGREPEMTYTPAGKATTRVSVAVSRKYTDGKGEKQEATQWFNVVLWEKLAETANTYLHKGSKVYFAGRIGSRKYTDKTGQEREIWELVATDMELLDGPKTRGDDRDAPPPGDDVPF